MKRLLMSIAAVACLASPMIAASPAFAQRWDHDGRGDRGDRGDRHWDRGDRHDGDRGDRGERRRWDGDRDGRGDGDHGDNRWDDRRYNGYWYNNRWAYGRPPEGYLDRPGFRADYRHFRRGGYLPGYYNSYAVNDYYRYHLRPPPRGYRWVRVHDDYLLVAIATGLIFDIIANGDY
jgi:Ni/Co efflux regulator RcnB